MCDVGTGNPETNFGSNLTGSKLQSMPWETFKRVADEAHTLWPRAHMAIVYTEPLIWPLIGKALHYVGERGQWASITTNGLLLSRWAKEIAAARCKGIGVSLDGPEEVHDQIRRKPGSFKKAVEGIEALLSQPNPPKVEVYCAISEYNVGSLARLLDDLRRLPLHRVGLIHTNFVTAKQALDHNRDFGDVVYATPTNVFEVDPARVDVERLSEELQQIFATRYPFEVIVNPKFTSVEDLTVYYRHPEIPVGRACRDAFNSLMVDSDGEVVPTHGRCYRFPVMNIRDGGLGRAWNHEKIVQLRKELSRSGLMPACTRCTAAFHGKPPRREAHSFG
jgi:radical SAM protein with 4Fe4S-binding SPASM domain